MNATSWIPSRHGGKILLLCRFASLVNLTITIPLSLALGSGSIICFQGFIFMFTTPIHFIQILWQASIYNAAKKAPSTRCRPFNARDTLSRYHRRNRPDTRIIEPVSPIFNMITDLLEFIYCSVWYGLGMAEIVCMRDNSKGMIVIATYACIGALFGLIIHGFFALVEIKQYMDYRRAQKPCCPHCMRGQTTRWRGVTRRSDSSIGPSTDGLLPPAYDDEERAPLYEEAWQDTQG